MTEPAPDKPPRRPRYRGSHPRQFREKYKELQPERYAEDVARVLAGGKTPAGSHRPIMVREILEVLKPQPGETAVDCTLGYGGHAQELLKAVQPGGRLLGIDADPIELPKTEARLRGLGFPPDSLLVRRMNFAGAAAWIAEVAPDGADVLLADLGLSSMQIDDPDRGFTFKAAGPLDMRMNPSRGKSAADLLAQLDADELAELLTENADQFGAKELAAALIERQQHRPLTTTADFADAIRQAISRWRLATDDVEATVRRVFQAVRIAVNDELGSLDGFLRTLPYCLRPGGRVALLTFHSGEDRRVKQAFKAGLQSGVFSSIAGDVVRAGSEEQRANPRSSPAKLRWAIRADD
ncbi:16S rRNA (cytosine(1402)-N(4))-methyltransferase RsmH [Planctellipticum variicoloris]|uniref:16S rRNA (cytosine(1402)-N(4))-methyltransferase RsmH n=1 Tax=Planctellipticum variicoloris TaxID=3064265 RepID=UPI0030132754|nr:16S rRNA (cytosine(1402)-N(4))-methyltransferase RsmH [Planctomycetaceae bacterium SH412]